MANRVAEMIHYLHVAPSVLVYTPLPLIFLFRENGTPSGAQNKFPEKRDRRRACEPQRRQPLDVKRRPLHRERGHR